MGPRLRELWAARQILGNLVRKEVKVKYKSSVLGVAWSMLNPLLYLGVFSIIFGVVVPNQTPHFAIYLLSGLLAWNLYSTSLGVAVRSVTKLAPDVPGAVQGIAVATLPPAAVRVLRGP